MTSFKDPLTPLILNPVNIDLPIQEMQLALAEMGWLEKSLGRSWLAYRKDAAGRTIIYPEVWQGPERADLLNCMPNDNLKSQSFFKVEDPVEVLDFSPGQFSKMRASVSIIFWFRLDYISRRDPDYRFIEQLKAQVQRVISDMTFSAESEASVTILRIWEEADNVFRGYTIDKTKDQELVHPFGGFRFDCDLFYNENCPTNFFNNPGIFDRTFGRQFN